MRIPKGCLVQAYRKSVPIIEEYAIKLDRYLKDEFYDFYYFNEFILNAFAARIDLSTQVKKVQKPLPHEIDLPQFSSPSRPYYGEKLTWRWMYE